MHILVTILPCNVVLVCGKYSPSLLMSTMVEVVCVLSKFCRMSLVTFAIPNC